MYRTEIRNQRNSRGQDPDVYLLTLPTQPTPTSQYYFFKVDPSDPNTQVCAPDVFAETFKRQPAHATIPVVVLCPLVFNSNRVDVLGSVTPVVASQGQTPQDLDDVRPKSNTFIHELYHLVPWQRYQIDIVDESCEWQLHRRPQSPT